MRRLLAALLLSASVNAFAASAGAPAAAKPSEPRPNSCPCSRPGFVPLTDKARVVQAFWEARTRRRSSSVVSTVVLLGSLLGGSVRSPALNEAAEQQGRADAAYERARGQALAAGAIRFERRGDDELVFVLLERDVDYAITKPE